METFDQELGHVMLEEVLGECDVMVGRWRLSEMFEALVETYDHGQWAKLAKKLGCSSPAEARNLIRFALPQVLGAHPGILCALSLAAGARVPHIVVQKGEGKQMLLPFTRISEQRRISLIQEFQEDFSVLLQSLQPFEIGVEFTGSPHSLVLLDLVRRYFRGRFLVEACFPRGADDPVGLSAYREQIRAFYGLDPVEGPQDAKSYKKYIKTLVDEAVGLGCRAYMQAVNDDCSGDLVKEFESRGIEVITPLVKWDRDDVLSYIDLQNLMPFEPEGQTGEIGEMEEPKEPDDPEADPDSLEGWSRAKNGVYRLRGKIVKQDTVPTAVIKAFEGNGEGQEEPALDQGQAEEGESEDGLSDGDQAPHEGDV